MGNLVYLLAPIACAIMMGGMMWMMMRGDHAGMKQPPPGPGVQEEIDALRAEVAALREQTDSTNRAGAGPTA